jgi:hypothetical protein
MMTRGRRTSTLALLALAMSASTLLGAGQAAAQATCLASNPAVFTGGGQQCFTLPAGVTSVQVVAVGGRGGDGETYTPAKVGSAGHRISANYSGDAAHSASGGADRVAVVRRSTRTAVACDPAAIQTGAATTCTATVADADTGSASRTTGSIAFATGGAGTLGGASCALPADGAQQCQVTYTPSAAGTHRITAAHAGDAAHAGSDGTAAVGVTLPRPDTGQRPGEQPASPSSAALTHRIMVLDRGLAVLTLTCTAPAGQTCRGTVELSPTDYRSRYEIRKSAAEHVVRFSVKAGESKRLRVPVPAATHAQLRERGKAVVMATLRLAQADGSLTRLQRAFTLFRRP